MDTGQFKLAFAMGAGKRNPAMGVQKDPDNV